MFFGKSHLFFVRHPQPHILFNYVQVQIGTPWRAHQQRVVERNADEPSTWITYGPWRTNLVNFIDVDLRRF